MLQHFRRGLWLLQGVVALIPILNVSAFAFHPKDHAAITQQAFAQLGAGVSQALITEVINANLCVDEGTFDPFGNRNNFDKPCSPTISPICGSCLNFPELHFDDETFATASKLLRRRLEDFELYALEDHRIEARKALGAALHAVQDFYAHSNWVDLGNRDIFNEITNLDTYLGSVYTAKHPMLNQSQDVCDHGHVLLGNAVAPTGQVLTSGYWFKSGDWIDTGAPLGKCAHGTVARTGIAKDDEDNSFHFTAWDLAERHSEQLIKDWMLAVSKINGASERIFGISTSSTNTAPVQTGQILRACQQHLYDQGTFVFLVERFGDQVKQWGQTDADIRRLAQQGSDQDLTKNIYAAGLLDRGDCAEPVVRVLTGNQVPNTGGRVAAGTFGLTIVVTAMTKAHCEAISASLKRRLPQGMFEIRFEPPGPTSKWVLGQCADNPLVRLLNLPQPNTVYIFTPLDVSISPVPINLPAPPGSVNKVNKLCDLTSLAESIGDAKKKAEVEDLFLRMVGALNELSVYRRAFLRRGITSGLIDLFPTAYYNTTLLELQRIQTNQYQYPDMKLRQMIAFYDSYKRNREAYDKGQPTEDHWTRHFLKVQEVQRSLPNILTNSVLSIDAAQNGLQQVLDTGMEAHIVFDFPRALRSAFDSSGGRGPSWTELQPDFQGTEKIFPDSMDRTMLDIASSGILGAAVMQAAQLVGGMAWVTQQVFSVLPGNAKLDPTGVTNDYIVAVRSLSWSRAQQGPPWPWPLEPQFQSSATEMHKKGEQFCESPLP